ncbi:hypothetical protein AVEN_94496-1 [Araneus ventricosus]|uniref:Uncharacterized protein n=1 Tax=Araneus ventricosus TaxID=182803 RepID=A0A4Y2WNN1_ARAVE|nr:hypothetical protein AVEN_94496-1 [Araneus ventricosus]
MLPWVGIIFLFRKCWCTQEELIKVYKGWELYHAVFQMKSISTIHDTDAVFSQLERKSSLPFYLPGPISYRDCINAPPTLAAGG